MRNSELMVSATVAVGSILGICAASAADLPVKAPVMAVAPIYSWTGFYIGGHLGWGESQQTATTTATPAGFGAPAIVGAGIAGIGILPISQSLNQDRFIGGVQAGYNWQINRWVVGLEADATFLDRNVANTQSLFTSFGAPINAGPYVLTAHNDWLATIRGRIGYTWDRFMLYGTGGAAFTRTSYSTSYASTNIGPPLGPIAANFGSDKIGYAVGAGAEWMASQNWLVRAEYLYYRFDGSSSSSPIVSGTCTAAVGCAIGTNTGDLQFHTVRVGLSYKFGGPVVAKY